AARGGGGGGGGPGGGTQRGGLGEKRKESPGEPPHPATKPPETHGDFDQPPFRRLRYFHGQMLTARDFQREQEYFREKLKLRMRCLLGYGVVCGLFVEPAPADDKATNETDQSHQAKAKITSGLGV